MKKDRSLTKQEKRDRFVEMVKTAAKAFESIGSAIAQAHPVTVGLLIMASTSVGQLAVGKETPENSWIKGELTGMYNGAQTIAIASATVPVISGGLNLLSSYLTRPSPG